MSPEERQVLLGACEVQSRTGAPLFLIPPVGTTWEVLLPLLDICEAEGVDWSRLVLTGGGYTSIKAVRELMYRGVTFCFEAGVCHAHASPSLPGVISDQEMASMIHQLIREGMANQILLSVGVAMKTMLRSGGGPGYGHLASDLLPRLSRLGVVDKTLAEITVTNPSRILSWWKPPPPKAKEVITWQCDMCHKGYPDEQERYTKFEYQYCSLKCVRKHTKQLQKVMVDV